MSEVEILLAPAGDQKTTVVLAHTAIVPEEMWGEYGPGAVGVGWDGGMLGLALHLQGDRWVIPRRGGVSDEGRDFYRRCSAAWGEANRAFGADPEVVARAVANTNEVLRTGAGSSERLRHRSRLEPAADPFRSVAC